LPYIIVLAVCVAVFCFSMFMIIRDASTDDEARAYQDEIINAATKESNDDTTPMTTGIQGEDEVVVPETYSLSDIDFEALWAINKDVVAWIKLPGTIIDYPVAKGETNDTYLRTLLNGEHHRFGTLFIDCDNTSDFSDFNTIIYGHNIKAGDMFHIVEFYKDQEYYDEHPYFVLYLPDGLYKLEPYAARYVSDEYFMPQRCYGDVEKYKDFINACINNSLIQTNTDMNENFKTVSLFTCRSNVSDERFLLHCKMSPFG